MHTLVDSNISTKSKYSRTRQLIVGNPPLHLRLEDAAAIEHVPLVEEQLEELVGEVVMSCNVGPIEVFVMGMGMGMGRAAEV